MHTLRLRQNGELRSRGRLSLGPARCRGSAALEQRLRHDVPAILRQRCVGNIPHASVCRAIERTEKPAGTSSAVVSDSIA